MKGKISNEQQLLFNLLKGEIPEELDGLDLNQLFQLFQRHRLFPAASGILAQMDDQNREKWRQEIRLQTLRSLQLTALLGNIIRSFEEAGIGAIPMKGPVLAHSLYGDPGSRHSVDLDILIYNIDASVPGKQGHAGKMDRSWLGERMSRVLEIAEGNGFLMKVPGKSLSVSQWETYFKFKNEVRMHNREAGVILELHGGIDNHQLMNGGGERMLFQDLKDFSMSGTTYRILNNNFNFLYLVYHGAMHQYTRIFWLRDVAEALQRWNLDHRLILSTAGELGIGRILQVSLRLVSEIFNAQIPAVYDPESEKENQVVRRITKLARERITGPENLTLKGRIRRQEYILLLKPGIRYKWRTLAGVVHRWYIGKTLLKP